MLSRKDLLISAGQTPSLDHIRSS